MSDKEESMNIYEYIQKKVNIIGDGIAEILLEGDAYFSEWEAINEVLRAINKFLDFLKRENNHD